MNNKEYTFEIYPFKARNLSEALTYLEVIQREWIERTRGGHYEEKENGLGWEIDINEGAEVGEYSFSRSELN